MESYAQPGVPNLLFLFTLLLVSSLIAFVGDWVGRRVGKRRLTLFGLRPRDTGVLVTILTGMFIAGFTVLVLSLLSENVRDGLLWVGQIKQERALLERANRNLQLQRQHLSQQIERVQASLQERQQALQDVTRRFDAQTLQLDKVRAQLALVRSQQAKARQKVEQLQSDIRRLRANLLRERGQYASAQRQLGEVQQQLRVATAELASAQQELASAARVVSEDFRAAEALRGERARLEAEVVRLQESQQILVRQAQRALELLASLQVGKLVADAGEEFARGPLDPTWPTIRLRERIDEFLAEANRKSLERGAASDASGRAVRAFGLQRGPGGQVELLPEETALQQVIQEIRSLGIRVVVRVLALRRFVEGEQVLVGFEIRPDRLVFPAGEVLAQVSVQPNSEETALFTALLGLLGQVHERARSAGLIPGPDGQFGVIPYGELFARLREIQQAAQPVVVQAVTAESIWTGDVLDIRLVVVQPEGDARPPAREEKSGA